VWKYLKIPIEIIRDQRLTMTEKSYLCLIAQLHNANGCTATNSYLSHYFNVSKQSSSGILHTLKDKGFIAMEEKRDNRGNIESRTILIIDWETRKILTRNKGQGKLDFENEPYQANPDTPCKANPDRGVSGRVSGNENPIKKTLELTLDTLESVLANKILRNAISPPKIQWTFIEPENLLIDLLHIGGKIEKQFHEDRPDDYQRIRAVINQNQLEGLSWDTKTKSWSRAPKLLDNFKTK
jgi:hypothetical protein